MAEPGQAFDDAASGPATALPFQAEMEAAFGQDFSNVRVIQGDPHQLGAMGAHAVTDGQRIVLPPNPSKETVAHELAHVVQDRDSAAGGGMRARARTSQPGDAAEVEAEQAAQAVTAGQAPGALTAAPTGGVMRELCEGQTTLAGRASCLHGKLQEIDGVVSNLREAADSLREAGTHWYGDDDNLLTVARNLTHAANGITQTGGQLSSLTDTMQDIDFDRGSTALSRAETALEAAELFVAFTDRSSLDSFIQDPTPHNAQAWANDVTGLFTRASNLFPDELPGIPGFVPQMIKGYLSAPAAYVSAFTQILNEYTAGIDSAAGFSDADIKVVDGNDVLWEGHLSHLYLTAPAGLRSFMTEHRDEDGVDLYEASQAGGIAHLLHLINQHASPEQMGRWIDHIGRYQ